MTTYDYENMVVTHHLALYWSKHLYQFEKHVY